MTFRYWIILLFILFCYIFASRSDYLDQRAAECSAHGLEFSAALDKCQPAKKAASQ